VLTQTERDEYLEEIRRRVCSVCVERPPGGPPCGPLGKPCGIELHLAQLIESVREVHSPLIEPYLEHNRHEVCETCVYHRDSRFCPCPMDSLIVLLVEAVEEVERRRQERGPVEEGLGGSAEEGAASLAEILRAYDQATGCWTGCDWPTRFGTTEQDLNGCTPEEARRRAGAALEPEAADWEMAALWLARVQATAARAETEAALAVKAAQAGDWPEALAHARQAQALEFASGRALWRDKPPTWGPFFRAVQAAASREE
jgi:hypothetical protein